MAALSIAGPPAIFTGMLMAEPFGYTLSLCVVLVGLRGGRDRRHAVVAGPTAFSRRRRRRRARRARLCVGAGLRLRPLEADVFVILLAAVAAIAPSAVVGVAQAIARPRSRVEAAFGWIVVSLTALLVTQCVLWGDVHRVQERYLGYALPLLAVAFAVRSSRPGRRPVQEIGVAAGFAVVAALVPLSGYAIYAFIRLERALGGMRRPPASSRRRDAACGLRLPPPPAARAARERSTGSRIRSSTSRPTGRSSGCTVTWWSTSRPRRR